MIILITGARGQLGKEFVRQLQLSHTVVGLGKEELDITNKYEVESMISTVQPDLIIHSAAFTAVDECERKLNQAFDVNAIGACNVAQAANLIRARLVSFSSDYVFNGEKGAPYVETDIPQPISIYGISKKIGDHLTQLCDDYLLIRTSWLYGHGGKNFVNTMLGLAKKNKEIRVVDDQMGSPTYVNDLVQITIELFNKPKGTYHVTNSGRCTWYEFAKGIFEEAGYSSRKVHKTTTEEFGALAPRPRYSVLDNQKLISNNINPPQHWKDALKEYIRKELKN